MPAPSSPTPGLRLLVTAEQIADLDAELGDPRAQAWLELVVERLAHAVVDVATGAAGHPRPFAGPGIRAATQRSTPVDRASCSAAAAQLHQAAAVLNALPAAPAGQAATVARALDAVARALQRFAQDVDGRAVDASAGQRLVRVLRRVHTGLQHDTS